MTSEQSTIPTLDLTEAEFQLWIQSDIVGKKLSFVRISSDDLLSLEFWKLTQSLKNENVFVWEVSLRILPWWRMMMDNRMIWSDKLLFLYNQDTKIEEFVDWMKLYYGISVIQIQTHTTMKDLLITFDNGLQLQTFYTTDRDDEWLSWWALFVRPEWDVFAPALRWYCNDKAKLNLIL